ESRPQWSVDQRRIDVRHPIQIEVLWTRGPLGFCEGPPGASGQRITTPPVARPTTHAPASKVGSVVWAHHDGLCQPKGLPVPPTSEEGCYGHALHEGCGKKYIRCGAGRGPVYLRRELPDQTERRGRECIGCLGHSDLRPTARATSSLTNST